MLGEPYQYERCGGDLLENYRYEITMNLRSLIAADKSSVKTGEWKRGEIPRSRWPSRRARAKAYKYGPAYQWRIINFTVEGNECRLLLLLNESKQIFRATLGLADGADTINLCDYEYHASEPGWHVHARCDDHAVISAATNRFGGTRLPRAGNYHRRMNFKFRNSHLTPVIAFNLAVSVFGIDKTGGGI